MVVSANIERVPDAEAFAACMARWEAAGRLGDGSLIEGGFRRLRLDMPGYIALYANHQGGYYVRCPETRGNLARAFSAAVQAWRAGGPRSLVCEHCGQAHPLEEVSLAPPGAFARGAVIFSDVASVGLADDVLPQLRPVLGEARVIVRRVG